ncbi:MAG: hypothetical protein LBQ28_00590 [Prevotellaceae bacterium]|jgi:hypothetical protein|nr:hypothetical protein [Prevotellaceae bacterium]
MANQDYIPQSDGKFLEWVKILFTYVRAHLTEWGLSESLLTPIDALIAKFDADYARAEDPNRGKADVLAKNESRDALKTSVRAFVKAYLTFNPLVTDEDRDRMGLPVHKTTRTPAPVAHTYPDLDVDSGTIRRLTIHFYDQGSKKSKAKPAGQHGAEIKWAILESPPASLTELTNSGFDTHTPFTLEFDENQRGQTVYFCLCWENTRGEKGPWSEIVSAIIP